MQNNKKFKSDLKLCIFDFDGILVPGPTKKDIEEFLNNTYKLIAWYNNIGFAEAKAFYMKIQNEKNYHTLNQFFRFEFPEIDISLIDRFIFSEYNSRYKKLKKDREIIEYMYLLRKKGVRLTILTNNKKSIVDNTLSTLGLNDVFDCIVGSEQLGLDLKPHQNSYLMVMNMFGVSPENTIFVDDTLVNVEAAESLGISSIHINEDESNSKITRYNDLKKFLRDILS